MKRERVDERGRDVEDADEEGSGGGGTEDNTARPGGCETGVVIGVEVREEVGEGEVAGVTECVDEEAGVRDEFGVGNGGR